MMWRAFIRALRGGAGIDGLQCGDLADSRQLDLGARHPVAAAATPVVTARLHVLHACIAALRGDDAGVVRHTRLATLLLVHLQGTPLHAVGLVVVDLGASIQLAALDHRTADAAERSVALTAEMAAIERWMAERAARAPRRFESLHHLAVALRCAARVRFDPAQLEPALRAFDLAARSAVAGRHRLQAVFVLAQAARFHVSQALHTSGRGLIEAASAHYADWFSAATPPPVPTHATPPDASASNAAPRGPADRPNEGPPALVTDRLAAAWVSQAMAGPNDPHRIVRRIVAVIARISGATDVGLFIGPGADLDFAGTPVDALQARGSGSLHPADPAQWTLVAVACAGQPAMATRVSAAAAGLHGFTPSAVRHALGCRRAERIDEVSDDPRFGLDPDAAEMGNPAGSASMLPLRSSGRCNAVLLIENRLATRAFANTLVATLELVAGQLSMALHDALLHSAMARRMGRTARRRRDTIDDIVLRDRAIGAATEAVSILDATSDVFEVAYVNTAFETLTGFEPAEVVGRSFLELYGDDTSQPGIETLCHAVRRGAPCKVTVRCHRRNGEMFWNELSIAPMLDASGLASHHVCMQRDVTERRHRAAVERLRSERLEAVFALSPDGVVVIDASQKVASVNPAFESLTGLRGVDLAGSMAGDLDACLAARTDGGRVASWHSEQPATIRLVRPGLRVLRRHVRRGPGAGQDTVLYFRDITRESEVDRMKSEFLATVARELETPMTSVASFTERLLDRRSDDASRTEMLEIVHRQTAALTALLDELLDMARVEPLLRETSTETHAQASP